MALASELLGLARLAARLRPSLKNTIAPDAARLLVRQWVVERDARFLRAVEQAVFSYRRSPYRALLEHAGCEYGDLVAMVRQHGLEGALERLSASGVYVTWEELKGRVPIVRGSRTFHFEEANFDSPLITTHYRLTSGGTTGVPVRVRIDIKEHRHSAPDWAVLFAAHGWIGRPLIFWTGGHTGMANRYLRCAKFGVPYAKWFTTADRISTQRERLHSAVVHGLARWAARLPAPEAVPVDKPQRVCDYLLGLLGEGLKPLVNTTPSAAARLSIEIQERGRNLDGVSFLLGAEPVTDVRRATIEACGAAVVPTYGTSECGWIGAQFPGARVADEVHLFRDAFAVVARDGKHDVELDVEPPAHPILFTNFRPGAPKVLLNAEIGDSAVIEDGPVTGLASELGYTVRLHTIRSFRKITAWGTTFAQADLYQVLEDAMPRRFGGSLANYQLVERADARGLPRLILRVSPAIGPLPDEELRSALLSEISQRKRYYGSMTALIATTNAVTVERCEPVATGRGKILPVLIDLT